MSTETESGCIYVPIYSISTTLSSVYWPCESPAFHIRKVGDADRCNKFLEFRGVELGGCHSRVSRILGTPYLECQHQISTMQSCPKANGETNLLVCVKFNSQTKLSSGTRKLIVRDDTDHIMTYLLLQIPPTRIDEVFQAGE
jgi:hypothetical protein